MESAPKQGTVELVSSPVIAPLKGDDSPRLPPSPQPSMLLRDNSQRLPVADNNQPLALFAVHGTTLTDQINEVISEVITVDLAVKDLQAAGHQKEKGEGLFLAIVGLLCGFMLIMGCIFLIVDQYTPEKPEELPPFPLNSTTYMKYIQFLVDQQQEAKSASWALQAGNWFIFLSSLGFIITIVVHGFRRCLEAKKAHADHEKNHGKNHRKQKVNAIDAIRKGILAANNDPIASHENSFGSFPSQTMPPPTTPIRNSLNQSLEQQPIGLDDVPIGSLDVPPQIVDGTKSRYGRAYGAYNPVGHRRHNAGYNKNYYL